MAADRIVSLSAGERDPRIDAVRGLSLMGILVVNLPFFTMPYGFAGAWWHGHDTLGLGTLSAWLIQALFENKFILIFAFLFGLGAARQVEHSGYARFAVRMAFLGLLNILRGTPVVNALLGRPHFDLEMPDPIITWTSAGTPPSLAFDAPLAADA